jgi:hypothetical protein
VLRLIEANPKDPFTIWIEQNSICPCVANATMAQALKTIRTHPNVEPGHRHLYEKRYDSLCQDLRNSSREAILTADFDLKSAAIFADLLSFADSYFGEIELIPAAIAVQHNINVVISNNDGEKWDEFLTAWKGLSASIPPEMGALSLSPFKPFL